MCFSLTSILVYLSQGVDGVEASPEVQVTDVSPGPRVLPDEGAVLVEGVLSSFAVVHQAVVTV